jgi:ribosomal protein L3 glutamine methyltransferase
VTGPTTLAALVDAAAARLRRSGVAFGQGTTNAYDEAAWIVLGVLGVPFDRFEAKAGQAATETEIAAANGAVEARIASRLPTAYQLGEAWLQGVRFLSDRRSIVPRSYIAELLADADEQGTLDAWLSDRTRTVLDLCTGNGSLAVLAALAYPEVTVVGADIDPEALALARANVALHGLEERVRLIESDLFAGLGDQRFDLVLCNPPYVTDAAMAALPPEYRAEPALALAGGADGMDVVRRIVAGVGAHLADDGLLVLEIGRERVGFEAACPGLEHAWLETSGGEDRVVGITAEALRRRGARRPSSR